MHFHMTVKVILFCCVCCVFCISVADVLVGSLHGLLQLSVSHTDFSCILQGDKSAAQSEKEPSLFVSRYLGRDRRGDTNQGPDKNTT